ncbi:MAG: pro-sigmaK processing inhibitor BofA family protein [Clostridia bacterium]|nr:pro-sigmaK processing inhibitor BofA family protein [Clostridia bacterium]
MEIFIYIAAIIGVCLIAKLFAAPIKFILKLFANAILGGLALIIINFIGQYFGFHIDLNFVTALVAGVLGLPGIAVLFILQML